MPALPTAVAGPAALLAAVVRALTLAALAAASCAYAQLLFPSDFGPVFWPAAGIVFGLAWHRGWRWALAAAMGAAAWRWLESGSALGALGEALGRAPGVDAVAGRDASAGRVGPGGDRAPADPDAGPRADRRAPARRRR